MTPQPLVVVADVEASSRWYQRVLGFTSGHGGRDYERLMWKGRMAMQLHSWDAHEHPHLGKRELRPHGNGVVLWFQMDDIDAAFARASHAASEGGGALLDPLKLNPNAWHREFWLCDPDGYVVVVAGREGDTGPQPPV